MWKFDTSNSRLFLAFHKMAFSKGKTYREIGKMSSRQYELVRLSLIDANKRGITGFGKARQNNPELFAKMGSENMAKTWTHDVQLLIEKTKPGWLDMTIEMRISWKGEEENVKGFTRCAEDYIKRLRRTF